ncbi:hypothetical protein [Stutzerimonas chloritidismutans]|uniref:Uncharacterized protein n=1 Tax=Stutzerimonas chloritidismutans TaxID=203192 RepID=A0ABU9M946_STUCH
MSELNISNIIFNELFDPIEGGFCPVWCIAKHPPSAQLPMFHPLGIRCLRKAGAFCCPDTRSVRADNPGDAHPPCLERESIARANHHPVVVGSGGVLMILWACHGSDHQHSTTSRHQRLNNRNFSAAPP